MNLANVRCRLSFSGKVSLSAMIGTWRSIWEHWGSLDVRTVQAELGEVIAGEKAGLSSAEQITIYGGVGLAFQDLATSWYVYQQARHTECRNLDFLS